MSKQIEIKLVKSIIGRKPKHVEIARNLGLKKINSTVLRPDNAAVRGMIKCVDYLVQVQEKK